MAFDASFLLALALLILGSGCLKGNISAQVGELYPAEAESRRTQGYTIFSAGINVGAILGPLTCGALAAAYGWHAGFGAAAVLMLLALIIYLAGQRHLAGRRRRAERAELPPMTAAERKRVALLILVAAMTLFPNVAYPMIWSIGILWVDQHVSLWTPLGDVPASWFNSVDPFASVVAVPPLVALWAWQAKRGREPSDVVKIGIGSLLTGLSAFILVAGALLPATDGKTAVWWPLAGFFGMGVAFLYYWPVLLALISQAAPKQVTATMMGGVYLSFFLGSVLMGWVGSFYDGMSPAAFWTLDGMIGVIGGVLVLAIARPVSRALETMPDGDAAGS
jgi:POT family proton-dependent oligopeptide transporter